MTSVMTSQQLQNMTVTASNKMATINLIINTCILVIEADTTDNDGYKYGRTLHHLSLSISLPSSFFPALASSSLSHSICLSLSFSTVDVCKLASVIINNEETVVNN